MEHIYLQYHQDIKCPESAQLYPRYQWQIVRKFWYLRVRDKIVYKVYKGIPSKKNLGDITTVLYIVYRHS